MSDEDTDYKYITITALGLLALGFLYLLYKKSRECACQIQPPQYQLPAQTCQPQVPVQTCQPQPCQTTPVTPPMCQVQPDEKTYQTCQPCQTITPVASITPPPTQTQPTQTIMDEKMFQLLQNQQDQIQYQTSMNEKMSQLLQSQTQHQQNQQNQLSNYQTKLGETNKEANSLKERIDKETQTLRQQLETVQKQIENLTQYQAYKAQEYNKSINTNTNQQTTIQKMDNKDENIKRQSMFNMS